MKVDRYRKFIEEFPQCKDLSRREEKGLKICLCRLKLVLKLGLLSLDEKGFSF